MQRRASKKTALLLLGMVVLNPLAYSVTPTLSEPTSFAEAPFFTDVGTHWAGDAILWLAERGTVQGSFDPVGNRLVRPDDRVTRAEVVKLVTGLKGLQPVANASAAFTDSTNHWANGYLAVARMVSIATGYPDGSFQPDGQITRAELAALIVRAFEPVGRAGGTQFADVPATHWAATTITAAAQAGWLRGFQDGLFRPEQQATRAEAFTVLARVDQQQALANTVKAVAYQPFGGSTRGYIQRALTTLQPFGTRAPGVKLAVLENDLGPGWTDGDRIPTVEVWEHQIAVVSDLVSLWNTGQLRRPGLVGGLSDLLMAARQGAELATADAEMVLGTAGATVARPSDVRPVDWAVAQELAKAARQAVIQAAIALSAADAVAAMQSYRTAWEAGTKAVTLVGVNLTPDDTQDRDADGVPDDLELRFGANPLAIDTDGDGLTDLFEMTYGGPFFQPGIRDTDGNGVPDGEEDTDQDGLSNLQEQKLGTNPLRADTDGDGLSDGEEVALGTNPLMADTDRDTIPDGAEVRLGTNPKQRDVNQTVTMQLKTPDGSATITGPAGALAGARVEVPDQTPYQQTPGLVSNVTAFTLSGPFSARIEMPIHPDQVLVNPDELRIFYFKENTHEWVPVEGKQGFDPTTGRAWAETTHFTSFAVFRVPDWRQTWSVQQCTDRTQEQAPKAVDLALALDSSRSMTWSDPEGLRKLAALQLVMALLQGDQAAVIDFDSSAKVLQSLTNDFDAVASAILQIDAFGGTAIDQGILASLAELERSGADRAHVIVVLTDGQNDPFPFDSDVIDQAVAAGSTIFTIGLGDDIDKRLLEQIAGRTGGRFFHVQTAADLPKAFERVNATMGLPDTDGDGLTDCEEMQGMLGPNGQRFFSDPNKVDSDGDGLSDRAEMGERIEPDLIAGHSYSQAYWVVLSDPMRADSDGDGLDDSAERALGTNPLKADTDGDGLTDEEEQRYGTDPLQRDTDGDGIADRDEVYSLYLNALQPDAHLLSSIEWKVGYHKGTKLGFDCAEASGSHNLRRCLDTFPFKLGQAVADLVAATGDLIDSAIATADFALGLAGTVADHLADLSGDESFRLDAYYSAIDSAALRKGEETGDALMGFSLQFLLNQAELGTDAANLFGANLSVDGLRAYMDLQSAAFQYGRTSGDVFQGLVGLTQLISGVGTIVASISGGALVTAGSGGLALPGGVAIAWSGVTAGAAQVTAGIALMAKSGRDLSKRTGGIPANTGMSSDEHAKKLRKNLVAKEGSPPKEYAAHHIVPSTHKDEAAAKARAILEQWGIDIDAAENGVFLRNKRTAGGATAYHPKIHTTTYLEKVVDRLKSAASREEVIEVLHKIAEELKANTFLY